MTWRDAAACKGDTATMFSDFPAYGPALAVCAGCPVIVPCRRAGADEPWGVWGGTTPEERGFMNGQRCHTVRRARRLRQLVDADVISEGEKLGA